jgi:glycosyltransferase involved in cell wall biosynthesis
VSNDKITIVNSIVDTSRFEGIEKQECEPYFAYCGNGNNKKDKVDELIKVFARVAARHEDIKFYIIGPTKQVYKDEKDNVQLVHELGLDERVVFTGMKPASEVPQLLVNAKALFLTRPDTLQNRAGFSTKLGEYLASGNPVVAAGVGDIPLYLIDHENAFLFEPGDFSAVEDAMEYILANPEAANKIGLAGKLAAETHFNSLIESKKLTKAFESIITN